MPSDAKMLQALAVKAKEQSETLTLYARQELGLSSERQVKLTVSITRVRTIKLKPDSRGWVYDQEPIPEDWTTVIGLIKKLMLRKHTRVARWEHMIDALHKLRKSKNRAYVYRATSLNLNLERNGHPYKLVRVEKPGEETLYSLRVAKVPTQSP